MNPSLKAILGYGGAFAAAVALHFALAAALGGVLGLLLASWGIQVLSALRDLTIPWHVGIGGSRSIPWFVDVRIGTRFFLYATVISLLTCATFEVLPALGASITSFRLYPQTPAPTPGPSVSRHPRRRRRPCSP